MKSHFFFLFFLRWQFKTKPSFSPGKWSLISSFLPNQNKSKNKDILLSVESIDGCLKTFPHACSFSIRESQIVELSVLWAIKLLNFLIYKHQKCKKYSPRKAERNFELEIWLDGSTWHRLGEKIFDYKCENTTVHLLILIFFKFVTLIICPLFHVQKFVCRSIFEQTYKLNILGLNIGEAYFQKISF